MHRYFKYCLNTNYTAAYVSSAHFDGDVNASQIIKPSIVIQIIIRFDVSYRKISRCLRNKIKN